MNKIHISGYFYITIVIGLYFLPIQWLLGWLAAAAVHELSHYLTLKACGVKVYSCLVGPLGAVIETETMKWWQEFLSTLAGPVGGGILIFAAKHFPHAAICAFFHSAYNLLPMYPLDGGRLLRCTAAAIFTPRITMVLSESVTCIVLIMILVATVYFSFVLKLGYIGVIAAVALLAKTTIIKLSCKETKQIVQ